MKAKQTKTEEMRKEEVISVQKIKLSYASLKLITGIYNKITYGKLIQIYNIKSNLY